MLALTLALWLCALADGPPTFAASTDVLADVTFIAPDPNLDSACPHCFHLCSSPLTLFFLWCITHVYAFPLILTVALMFVPLTLAIALALMPAILLALPLQHACSHSSQTLHAVSLII